jgi:hypothetical protein
MQCSCGSPVNVIPYQDVPKNEFLFEIHMLYISCLLYTPLSLKLNHRSEAGDYQVLIVSEFFISLQRYETERLHERITLNG